MHLTKPVCRLCNKPYIVDLIYIRCEKCQYWVHADALELDESKIFCLMGFKCSRCVRPYLDPGKKKALEYKIDCIAPELDIYEMDSDSLLSEQFMEEDPDYSALFTKEEVGHVAADSPLVLSVCEVEQYPDSLELEYEWNNSNESHCYVRKLPVRRHIKQENDIYCPPLPDPFHVVVSAPFESNATNSTEKLPVKRHIKRENNSDYHSAIYSFQVEVPSPSEVNSLACLPNPLSPEALWMFLTIVSKTV